MADKKTNKAKTTGKAPARHYNGQGITAELQRKPGDARTTAAKAKNTRAATAQAKKQEAQSAKRASSAKKKLTRKLALVVAPIKGGKFYCYAFGNKTSPTGRVSASRARTRIDGQPKGGFDSAKDAVKFAKGAYKNDAAFFKAVGTGLKGTIIDHPTYRDWPKQIAATVFEGSPGA